MPLAMAGAGPRIQIESQLPGTKTGMRLLLLKALVKDQWRNGSVSVAVLQPFGQYP